MSSAVARKNFEIVPVEGTVNDRALILWVSERHFDASTTLVADTTLSNFMSSIDIGKGDAVNAGFGSYIYKHQLDKQNGNLRFVFLKNKTETEALEVVKPAATIWRPLPWPNVLLELYAVKGDVQELEAGTIATDATTNKRLVERYFDRYRLINGGTFNTEIFVEEFFSASPITSLFATEPRPEPVYYNFLGMSNRLDALHTEITIPELVVSKELVDGFGSKPITETWQLGSIFPATNMATWEAHYRTLDVTERDGGYYYRREYAYPPPIPKSINK